MPRQAVPGSQILALAKPWMGTNCGFSAVKWRPAVLNPPSTTGKGFSAEQKAWPWAFPGAGNYALLLTTCLPGLKTPKTTVLVPNFAIIVHQDAFWVLGTHGNHQDKLVTVKEKWIRARSLEAPPLRQGGEPALPAAAQHWETFWEPKAAPPCRYSQMPWRTHLGLFCHQTPKK